MTLTVWRIRRSMSRSKRTLLGIAEGNRRAGGAGARGAADAVDIGFRHMRQIVVDHMRHAVDVDAARRDVGRNQHVDLAGLEFGKRALALALRLVAVDGRSADALPR